MSSLCGRLLRRGLSSRLRSAQGRGLSSGARRASPSSAATTAGPSSTAFAPPPLKSTDSSPKSSSDPAPKAKNLAAASQRLSRRASSKIPDATPEIPALQVPEEPGRLASAKSTEAVANNSVVIFDKDGTLICFHSMWTPWAMDTAKGISVASGLESQDISGDVYELLGFDPDTRRVRPGLLAEATMPEIRAKLVQLLVIHRMAQHEAEEVVEAVWRQREPHTQETLKSLHNLQGLFASLKAHGVKVAICTADSRRATEEALEKLGIAQLVDAVVCGDDEGTRPKPHKHNALMICEKLGIDPKDAYMVGDTLADMGMGRSAELGGTIGVLSGVASESELEPWADHVVPDVGSLLPIVLRRQRERDKAKAAPKVSGWSHPKAVRKLNAYLNERRGAYITPEKDLVRKLVAEPSAKAQRGIKGLALLKPRRGLHTSAAAARYKIAHPEGPAIEEKMSHIIVGAGSAGCVLANRLSEDPDNRVLLIENGPKDHWWDWRIHMPAALMYNLCGTTYNYHYQTMVENHMDKRVMYWPRGKVWGGSSSLNAMVYIRGHPFDYDRWEREEGCPGWGYASSLPYFRKAESYSAGGDDYRGDSGPLHVTRGPCENPLYQAFISAGEQAGYGRTEDLNGYRQEGCGPMDATIHQGKRWSASQAYLWPALERPNLWAMDHTLVTAVLFDGRRAIGVEYTSRQDKDMPITPSMKLKAYAEAEVILAAGAIHTPMLLMYSGIGDAKHLYLHHLEGLVDLPGVGANLQDHLEVYVQQACTRPITLYNRSSWRFPHNMIRTGLQWFANQSGDGASNHLEAGGFVRTKVGGATHPDIQFHFLPSTVLDHGRVVGDRHAYQVHVGPMRPTSRGYLKLLDRDPRTHPLIFANYLATEGDRAEFRESVRIAREIFAQPAFDEFRGEELAPGPKVESDAEIDAFLRAKGDSAYHPSCTAKMGPASDPTAVVDPETLTVHGTSNLRVCDASIMPSVVSGNLNGPVIMMAEKAADIILGKPPLPKADVPIWTHNGDVRSIR